MPRVVVLMTVIGSFAVSACHVDVTDDGAPTQEDTWTPYDDFYIPPNDPRRTPTDVDAPSQPPGPPPLPPTCVAGPHADDADALLIAGHDALDVLRSMAVTQDRVGAYLPKRMLVSALEAMEVDTDEEQQALDIVSDFWSPGALPAFEGDAFQQAQWGNEQGQDLRVQVLDGDQPLAHNPLALGNYLGGAWVTMEPVDPDKRDPLRHTYRISVHFDGLGPLGHLLEGADTLTSPIEFEWNWLFFVLDMGVDLGPLDALAELTVGSDLALWRHTDDASLSMTAMGAYTTGAQLEADERIDIEMDSFSASHGDLELTVVRQGLSYQSPWLTGSVQWRLSDAEGVEVGRAVTDFGTGARYPVATWSCDASGR